MERYPKVDTRWEVENIIFNNITEKDSTVANFLALVTKQYIYIDRGVIRNRFFCGIEENL